MAEFINSIHNLQPYIALEWPTGCVYWKFVRVRKFTHRTNLDSLKFDGCMLGIANFIRMEPLRETHGRLHLIVMK